MEKIKIGKHNHTFTDLLKVLIFALVMLAPFGAVLSKCLYVATNKNAKESYYGETINNFTDNYIKTNEMIYGYEYYIQKVNEYESIKYFFTADDIYDIANDVYYGSAEIRIYSQQYTYINFQIVGSTEGLNYQSRVDNLPTFKFIFKQFTDRTNFGTLELFFKRIYNKYSFLDNVFYYSVNQIPQTQIFGWTTRTALYTGIETMTQGLGFDPNNNVLALLLTYWSLNTIIYIIFDIVIKAFTTLTHMIGNK